MSSETSSQTFIFDDATYARIVRDLNAHLSSCFKLSEEELEFRVSGNLNVDGVAYMKIRVESITREDAKLYLNFCIFASSKGFDLPLTSSALTGVHSKIVLGDLPKFSIPEVFMLRFLNKQLKGALLDLIRAHKPTPPSVLEAEAVNVSTAQD